MRPWIHAGLDTETRILQTGRLFFSSAFPCMKDRLPASCKEKQPPDHAGNRRVRRGKRSTNFRAHDLELGLVGACLCLCLLFALLQRPKQAGDELHLHLRAESPLSRQRPGPRRPATSRGSSLNVTPAFAQQRIFFGAGARPSDKRV